MRSAAGFQQVSSQSMRTSVDFSMAKPRCSAVGPHKEKPHSLSTCPQCRNGKSPSRLFHLGDAAEQMWQRAVGTLAHVNMFDANRYGYRAGEKEKCAAAAATLESIPLEIAYRPGLQPRGLRLECKRLMREPTGTETRDRRLRRADAGQSPRTGTLERNARSDNRAQGSRGRAGHSALAAVAAITRVRHE